MKKIIMLFIIGLSVLFLTNCNEKNTLQLNATYSITSPSCDSCLDGSIDLTIVGGETPYNITWSNGSNTEDLENIGKGSYTYSITDAKENTLNGSVEVNYYHELVRIETDFGNILIWLYDQTPLHKANFLKLTKDGFYDGLIFHRVIDHFMIQGGDPDGNGTGGPGYKIDAEILPALKHVMGAVGAARDNNPQKKSNGSQFYIVENENGYPSLNGNYTVFGIVVDGIDAVHSIASVATNSKDKPLSDVVMTSVEIAEYTSGELKTEFAFDIP
jgi:cyclophilin family peptidyl-prolyl cis-trans isomerase